MRTRQESKKPENETNFDVCVPKDLRAKEEK